MCQNVGLVFIIIRKTTTQNKIQTKTMLLSRTISPIEADKKDFENRNKWMDPEERWTISVCFLFVFNFVFHVLASMFVKLHCTNCFMNANYFIIIIINFQLKQFPKLQLVDKSLIFAHICIIHIWIQSSMNKSKFVIVILLYKYTCEKAHEI